MLVTVDTIYGCHILVAKLAHELLLPALAVSYIEYSPGTQTHRQIYINACTQQVNGEANGVIDEQGNAAYGDSTMLKAKYP